MDKNSLPWTKRTVSKYMQDTDFAQIRVDHVKNKLKKADPFLSSLEESAHDNYYQQLVHMVQYTLQGSSAEGLAESFVDHAILHYVQGISRPKWKNTVSNMAPQKLYDHIKKSLKKELASVEDISHENLGMQFMLNSDVNDATADIWARLNDTESLTGKSLYGDLVKKVQQRLPRLPVNDAALFVDKAIRQWATYDILNRSETRKITNAPLEQIYDEIAYSIAHPERPQWAVRTDEPPPGSMRAH